MAWSTTRRDDSARRRREIFIYAQHLAEDHRVRAAPHRHATRADVAAARAEAARELAPLVGLRLGDGRDEGLRAFDRLGGGRLRVDGGRTSGRMVTNLASHGARWREFFLCGCSSQLDAASDFSRPCAVTPGC